jgi:hypothetical protein
MSAPYFKGVVMNVAGRFKQWRSIRGSTFDDAVPALSLEARFDAVEYELKSILRDISRVRFSEQQSKTTLQQGQLKADSLRGIVP